MARFAFGKQENDLFVKYMLHEKNKKTRVQRSELLITAHGGFIGAQNKALRAVFIEDPIYENITKPFIPKTFNVVNERRNQRASVLRPPENRFVPKQPIAFFCDHGSNLKSEKDSTLRRIIQVRSIAAEIYPPQRPITNYNLGDVSKHHQTFANIPMERKDFIKAVLIEAFLLREKESVSKGLFKMQMGTDKNKILMVVPDILMITESTNLNDILSDPQNKHYTKIFCSFCRGQSGEKNSSMHAIERNSLISDIERKKIEQSVLNELKELKFLK